MTLVQTRNASPERQPAALLHGPVELSATAREPREPSNQAWHVLHTKSRQEKALARTLEAAGIHCELPLVKSMRFYGHRKREVVVPLFSNYVFVRGPLEVTYFATTTRRVVNVIPVHDQAGFDRDLKQIRLALAGGADLNPYRYLTVGRHVRVTAGPFKDVEGLIEEKPKPDRLILQIDVLGRAASLEIDASLLEPVERATAPGV